MINGVGAACSEGPANADQEQRQQVGNARTALVPGGQEHAPDGGYQQQRDDGRLGEGQVIGEQAKRAVTLPAPGITGGITGCLQRGVVHVKRLYVSCLVCHIIRDYFI